MRGEYNGNRFFPTMTSELPPRTRRIRRKTPGDGGGRGTTSACAENTHRVLLATQTLRNYLRVRGEYTCGNSINNDGGELPPRARRILTGREFGVDYFGTTSACAENTQDYKCSLPALGNYLRVRGEYKLDELGRSNHPGTTSACAENTNGKAIFPQLKGNYLRVRGEYSSSICANSLSLELPPRARRIRQCHL